MYSVLGPWASWNSEVIAGFKTMWLFLNGPILFDVAASSELNLNRTAEIRPRTFLLKVLCFESKQVHIPTLYRLGNNWGQVHNYHSPWATTFSFQLTWNIIYSKDEREKWLPHRCFWSLDKLVLSNTTRLFPMKFPWKFMNFSLTFHGDIHRAHPVKFRRFHGADPMK